MQDDGELVQEQGGQRIAAGRFARGTGDHVKIDLAPEAEDVARLVRALRDPITEIGLALQLLEQDARAAGPGVTTIRSSLRMIERLVRDLCTALVNPPRVMDAPVRPLGASSILCGASVLVVDEDVSQLQALANTLRTHGVTPMTATSVPECLVRVTAQRPEAVILDLSLGSSLVGVLAQVAPRVPIVVTTTRPADVALANARAYVLGKPFTGSELVVLLEQILIAPRKSR